MKKFALLFAILAGTGLGTTTLDAQSWCLTHAHTQRSEAEDLFNQFVVQFKQGGGHLSTELFRIPLVVHVIWRNEKDRQLMPMDRIAGQVEAANRDLRRLNPDAAKTRPAFQAVAADCDIQVCLATRLPDGSVFEGVVYHHRPGFEVFSDLAELMSATMMDPARYLNVWVVPDHAGGAAVFPWESDLDWDGFWVGAQWFGTEGEDLSPYMNEGSTFSHELAHYLGVYHTFHNSFMFLGQCELQDDPGIGDLCGDTPLDWTLPFSAEQCDSGEMFCEDPGLELLAQTENFMYYNQDSCTNMFTLDQRARMRACLAGIRAELVSESNLQFTGMVCAPVSSTDPVADPVNFLVYPNPSAGRVYFQGLATVSPSAMVRVFDPRGLLRAELRGGRILEGLDVSGWPSGLYGIQVFDGARMHTVRTLVVLDQIR
jgi:hypothetical protein